MSLASLFCLSFASALVSHAIFNRHEPSPIALILGTFTLQWVAFSALVVVGTSISSGVLQVSLFSVTYFIFLACSIVAYRLSSLHPLSSFPGPKAGIISKWWMVHRILICGNRYKKLQELHQKYGPLVRIGPNELSINAVPAIRSIYRLERAQFYQGSPLKGEALITILDRRTHNERRQIWARAVTSKALDSYVSAAKARSRQLVERLAVFPESGVRSVDIDKWLRLFFVDLMGDIGFSGGFETMKAGRDPDGWLNILAKGFIFFSSMGQVPWLRSVVRLLPHHGPVERFHKLTQSRVKEIRAGQRGRQRNDIFSILLDEANGHATLSDDDAAADATLLIVAATDSSIQTVLTLLRCIATDQAIQTKLFEEIKEVHPVPETLDVPNLLRLPYLDACIQESLRLIPPGPFGPPRTSGSSGTTILGVDIPPHTTVHVPVYAVHRDSDNFGPSADQFVPERWMKTGSKEPVDNRFTCNREAFVPFSAGYASCVGKQLALQNIKILVAELLNRFEFELPVGFDAAEYDASFKEYGSWSHDALPVALIPRSKT